MLHRTPWVLALIAVACGSPPQARDGGEGPGDASSVDGGSRETSDASVGEDAAAPDASAGQDAGPTLPPSWCSEDDTVFGALASPLGAGEWAELPVDDALQALMLHGHLTSWADSGVYDPVHRTIQWVGSPGSCCADPSAYQLLIYDVATDSWRAEETPWPDDTGHAWDGNAVDPEGGVHYFARSSSVGAWDGTSWSLLPDAGRQPIVVGLAYFESTGDLYLVGRNLFRLDGDAWTMVAPETRFGTYHQFAEYNPLRDVAWIGAGNNRETFGFALEADGTVRPLTEAPTTLNGDGNSMKTYDPVTGDYIVQNEAEDRWWTFDITTDTWTEITDAIRAARPETWSTADSAKDFVVAVGDCGVLFYLQWHDFTYRAFVYRHAS